MSRGSAPTCNKEPKAPASILGAPYTTLPIRAAQAARIGKVVYGAPSMDAGALGSLLHVGADPRLNYEFPVVGGLLSEESADLLAKFFSRHR